MDWLENLHPSWIVILLLEIPVGMIGALLFNQITKWWSYTSRVRARKRIADLEKRIREGAEYHSDPQKTAYFIIIWLPPVVVLGFLSLFFLQLVILIFLSNPPPVNAPLDLHRDGLTLFALALMFGMGIGFAYFVDKILNVINYYTRYPQLKEQWEKEITKLSRVV